MNTKDAMSLSAPRTARLIPNLVEAAPHSSCTDAKTTDDGSSAPIETNDETISAAPDDARARDRLHGAMHLVCAASSYAGCTGQS